MIIIIIIIFIDLYRPNINPGKEIFICALHYFTQQYPKILVQNYSNLKILKTVTN